MTVEEQGVSLSKGYYSSGETFMISRHFPVFFPYSQGSDEFYDETVCVCVCVCVRACVRGCSLDVLPKEGFFR